MKKMGNEVYEGKIKTIGDAYIIIDYSPINNGVLLKNGELFMSCFIPFNTILLGEKIKIDVLGVKEIELKLNPTQKNGEEYVVKGGGINKNAYVKVFLDFPKNNVNSDNLEKIQDVVREIYGEPDVCFKPQSSADQRRSS